MSGQKPLTATKCRMDMEEGMAKINQIMRPYQKMIEKDFIDPLIKRVNDIMSERDLRDEVIDGLTSVMGRLHISAVESHLTSAGIPDLDMCLDGTECKLELKFADKSPCGMRTTQLAWFRKRGKAGGTPMVLAKIIIDDFVYYCLYNHIGVALLGKSKAKGTWLSLANKTWFDKMNWRELAICLIKGKMR